MDKEEAILSSLIDVVKEKIGTTKITANTIHIVLKETMELVEELNIPGSDKQDNVVKVIKALVDDLVSDGEEKRLIIEIIESNMLENTISLVVQASKGQLNLNNKKTQEQITGCFSTILKIIVSLLKKKKSTSTSTVQVTVTNTTTNNNNNKV